MRCCLVRLSVLAVVPLLLAPLAFGQPAQGAPAHSQEGGGKVLRIAQGGFPNNFDPQRVCCVEDAGVSGLDYEGLTRLDEELNTVPAAAESWSFNEDGTVLIFTLRENLTYADGSPLEAERFRYAIERTCDPRTDAPYATTLFDVVGCEALYTSLDGDPGDDAALDAAIAGLGVRAVDERTLEVRLTHPAVYFPTVASLWAFFPVKREAIVADPDGWSTDPAVRIGNGPFRVVGMEPDTSPARIRFAANERYWGRAKLDGIEYVYFSGIPDEIPSAMEAYRRGEIDMVGPPDDELPAVEADPVLSRELLRYPEGATMHLSLNLTKEPFQDKKVREAFAYGFDRDGYCRQIDYGLCTGALSWIPEGVPGHIETEAYAFDPAKARQALAESSYGGPEQLPEVIWNYEEDNAFDTRRAKWLADLYRTVLGIELKLVSPAMEEWDAMYDGDPAHRPQLSYSGWWQDYPDPQYWLSVPWTCGSTNYAVYVGYCNPAFDALVARADAELDPATRLALYEEAHRLLLADAPTVIIDHPTNAPLVKPYVTGYTTVPDWAWPGYRSLLTLDLAPAA